MSEISRFYGIVITMYFREHNPPHFHVRYNEMEAEFDIIEGAFIKGKIPTTQARIVLAWHSLHKDELLEMWNSKEYHRIKPID